MARTRHRINILKNILSKEQRHNAAPLLVYKLLLAQQDPLSYTLRDLQLTARHFLHKSPVISN